MLKYLSLLVAGVTGSLILLPQPARALDTIEVSKPVLFASIGKKRVGLYAADGELSAFEVKKEAALNAQQICKALNYGNAVRFEYERSQRARCGNTTSLDYRVMGEDGKAEVRSFSVNPTSSFQRNFSAVLVREHFEFVSIECENIRSASLDTSTESETKEVKSEL